MVGKVVANKMNRTVTVVVTRVSTHPLYKKSFTRSKKFLVDDQIGVKPGDIVEIVKIKPISKMKHWKVVKVVGRDIQEIVSEQLQEAAKAHIAEVMPEEKAASPMMDEPEEVVEEKSKTEKAKPAKKVKKEAK